MKRKLISAVLAAGLLCACGPVGSAATEDYTTGQFIRGNALESAEGRYITAIGCQTATTGKGNIP